MLTGEHIYLGPLLPQDFNTLMEWADDIEAAHYNETYRPALWKQQEELWFPRSHDPSRVLFAVRRTLEPQIIGYVQIWNIDPVHHSALLGLRIGSTEDRNRGYGREALRLTIPYLWNQLHLSRIGLSVFSSNAAALHLYEKAGFVREGQLRQAVFINGHWLDIILMGLLHPSRELP